MATLKGKWVFNDILVNNTSNNDREDITPYIGLDEPTTDTKPVYLRKNGLWVKQNAYERQNGEWVHISTSQKG